MRGVCSTGGSDGNTESPDLKPSTHFPTSLTTPATSNPKTKGAFLIVEKSPERVNTSA